MPVKAEHQHQQYPLRQGSTPARMDITGDQQPDSGYNSQPSAFHSGRSTSSTPAAADSLGRDTRKLVDTINKLAEYGVESTTMPLPKLVVVGDQSSGKSSLIEAISEIKVPRASGTCTRCPLKINLKSQPTPAWALTLVRHYYYDPHARRSSSYPWVKLDEPENIVGPLPLKYEEVEPALHRAQEAILRPSQDQAAMLCDYQAPIGEKDVAFSPNIIQIDVAGPTLQDLTLFDLPGIIHDTADEDKHLPKLVRNLAKQYVDGSNTIVVLAVPMGTDMETSTALSYIRQWRATDRTVGVLTKPDILPKGDDLSHWVDVLNGRRFPLGHGYWVTKQPNTVQLKQRISHGEARQNEHHFFQQPPWSTTFATHRASFGTGALQGQLSRQLANEIAVYLPELRNTVRDRLAQVEQELSQYPKPPINPFGTVIRIVEKLRSDLDHLLLGDTPGEELHSNKLIREWRSYTEELHASLKNMQPLVVVNTGTESNWVSSSQTIDLDDSDDENAGQGQSSLPTPVTPSGTKRAGSAVSSSQESPTKRAKTRATPAVNTPQYAARYQLDDIKSKIAETVTSGVPSDSDPRAEDLLISHSMKHWQEATRHYLSRIHDLIERYLTDLMSKHTSQWMSTQLPGAIENAVRNCFDSIFGSFEQSCMQAVRADQLKPYTCNTEMLQFYRQKQLNFLRKQRLFARQKSYLNFKERSSNKQLSEGHVRDQKASAIKPAELGDDPRDAEIQVMARVRGYYHLAAGTLTDTIGKKSQLEVFEELRQQLEAALTKGLGIDGDDRDCVNNAKMLLTENPEREAKRMELATNQEKFQKALSVLDAAMRA